MRISTLITVLAVIAMMATGYLGGLQEKKAYNDGVEAGISEGRIEGRAQVEMGIINLAKQEWEGCGEIKIKSGELQMGFVPNGDHCQK